MKHRYTLSILLLCCALLTACTDSKGNSEPAETVPAETPLPAEESDAVPEPDAPFDAEGMHFSVRSGFYDTAFHLSISAAEGTEIYYTLDGSTPNADSIRYTEPILIQDRSPEENKLSALTGTAQPEPYESLFLPQKEVDKATVVRAVAIDKSGRQSAVVSNTYFVGFGQKAEYYQNVKIISLLTDADHLFDYENGIYMRGKVYDDWKNGDDYDAETPDYFMPGNYTQKGREWERPAAIQIFADGQLAAEQNIGIRIHGGATRSYPQKSLNIYARKDYGAGKLSYDLFSGAVTRQTDGEPVTEFDSFILRNGGNDAQYTRFSDKLVQSLVADRQFLTQGMEPCILFIDGEFWGHYEITEKLDSKFISAHYGVPAKDICVIKKEALDEGADAGFADWEQLWQWIRETDFSGQEAYEKLCSSVDMQGFMDYISTEIYINNADWGKPNTAMWKAMTPDDSNPYADGKWRFVLFDTEYSAGLYGEAQPDEDNFEKFMESGCFLADLFTGALENAGFRSAFHDTFMEIASQNFERGKVDAEIRRLSDSYQEMVLDTYDRFWCRMLGGSAAKGNYQMSVSSLRTFYDQRYDAVTEYLNEHVKP